MRANHFINHFTVFSLEALFKTMCGYGQFLECGQRHYYYLEEKIIQENWIDILTPLQRLYPKI